MKPRISLLSTQDQELVDRIVEGSEGAFRSLVVQYHPLAHSLAYRVLDDRQDAEEVVQDAFVKIHHALDRFRGESSLKTWILRIVLRLSLNRRRDRGRNAWRRLGLHHRPQQLDGEQDLPVASGAPNPEARFIAAETRGFVLRAIDQLSAPLREVLILNSLEDLGYDEIARILEIPVGTVGSRIHAARRKLVVMLRQYDLV